MRNHDISPDFTKGRGPSHKIDDQKFKRKHAFYLAFYISLMDIIYLDKIQYVGICII